MRGCSGGIVLHRDVSLTRSAPLLSADNRSTTAQAETEETYQEEPMMAALTTGYDLIEGTGWDDTQGLSYGGVLCLSRSDDVSLYRTRVDVPGMPLAPARVALTGSAQA